VHIADLAAAPVGSRRAARLPEYHTCDLLDAATHGPLIDAVRPTHLIHTAWVTAHGAYWMSPDNERWVEASLHLLDRSRADRILVTGSCAEDFPPTPYGVAKAALRQRLNGSAGLVWAKLFSPYGPGEVAERIIPATCLSLLRGEPARLSSGVQRRDFMHVEDVGRALAQLVLSPITGTAEVDTGHGVRVRDVADAIGVLAGAPKLIALGMLPDRTTEPERVVADATRLSSIGFAPYYSLASGLESALEYWRWRELQRILA